MELLHTTPLQQSVVGVGNVGQFTLSHRLMQPLIIAIGFATRLGVSCPFVHYAYGESIPESDYIT
jgi:hypothetical protein